MNPCECNFRCTSSQLHLLHKKISAPLILCFHVKEEHVNKMHIPDVHLHAVSYSEIDAFKPPLPSISIQFAAQEKLEEGKMGMSIPFFLTSAFMALIQAQIAPSQKDSWRTRTRGDCINHNIMVVLYFALSEHITIPKYVITLTKNLTKYSR